MKEGRERSEHIEQLHKEYAEALRKYCLGKFAGQADAVGRAEDCVQETFMIAYKKYVQMMSHASLKHWLFQTCKNRVQNNLKRYYRRQKRRSYSLDHPVAAELSDPISPFNRLEAEESYNDTVGRMYEMLLDGQREVFEEYYLKDRKIKDKHNKLGMPENTVKSILRRIRERLKKNGGWKNNY